MTSIDPTDPAVVESTVIDGRYGDKSTAAVTFTGNETSECVLQGVTITQSKGRGIDGGTYQRHTQATVSHCRIIDNGSFYTSSDWFGYTEGYYGGGLRFYDGTISHCIIADNISGSGGAFCICNALISHCTIADNNAYQGYFFGMYGGDSYEGEGGAFYECQSTISNSIVWGNEAEVQGDLAYDSTLIFEYSCVQDDGNSNPADTGNISTDPLFANTSNGDYQLQSEYGRWQPAVQGFNDNGTPADANDDFWEVIPGQWVVDEVTTPCIDAGDPASDWTSELWPHGKRINMGAYGGTPAASMSPNPVGNMADFNHDNAVDVSDFTLFCEDWLRAEYLLDADLNRNGVVDIADFANFTAEWMWLEP